MRRLAVVIVAGSLVWGSAFAKGSSAGHSSAKAVAADRANLVKARAVAVTLPRTAKQISAADANLIKARAAAEAMKRSKKGSK